ncbi:hypothetical protein NEPAR06_2190 [Nematocida parisii]|uniref:Uncharacterized protein n=1 Tax=Nematocida parisii (strain ERTm3) TaxID=935791 RepID=I3EK09_NEMP3|nr:uncharacterized protein NEPG_00915 [Nematocida parisii ERTm1]EIJ89556.1 hypothetical protein NEQG_00326 [Nematocida parisii ERTm3]KAI5145941.1 hypothetical protein NEPAR07_1971 [Nematocida parisii]EIJ94248.1 hypothetical protein NEPG_00915 [Nematocida parisii ERTm1]KAI5156587.1 hypothetical protein NEPAR06_2190 [Nematocida parisii]KAI5157851.1 hypothetical protein NEPAR05_1642 [Nematocida parisii]|eukprot:XP_013058744.1 hypothetical protein NEPG_00915 [Nematocida parisii ERTm1]
MYRDLQMKEKKNELFKNPSIDMLKNRNNMSTSEVSIDCTAKSKDKSQRYVKYNLCESILFNSK